jgi:hypothetical protein
LQHVFGGQGSNYTKEQVLEESILVEVFRQCHKNIEKNFGLSGLTTRHAPANMIKTYEAMARHLASSQLNEYKPGRTSAYNIPDVIDNGQLIVYAGLTREEEAENMDERPTLKDLIDTLDVIT